MIALLCLFLTLFASPFKSKSRLEAENAALRRQLIILRRKVHGRVQLTDSDRLFFIQLYRWFPSVVCVENSDSDVLVMQTADQGMRHDASDPLNWAREWRILGQGAVRSRGVVIARIGF